MTLWSLSHTNANAVGAFLVEPPCCTHRRTSGYGPIAALFATAENRALRVYGF